MSTTTGADTALDLDAIEARASAATKGPWLVKGMYPQEILANDSGLNLVATTHLSPDGPPSDTEFIAQARTDVPALVAEVRRLRPRVISGDVEEVTAALDGLPVGSIITCDAEYGGGLVYHKRGFPMSAPTWYETGFSARVRIATIARHQVPLTVLREGTGA